MTSHDVAAPSIGSFYDRRMAPLIYDLVVHAVFLPFGGAGRLRSRALDLLEVKSLTSAI